MIRISFQNSEALSYLRNLPGRLARKIYAACGARLEYVVRRHFMRRNREGNKQGWPSSGFWAREGAGKTALSRVTEHSAEVVISSPAIAHKIEGGTIRPKRARLLAIPASARAYSAGSPSAGRWASGELFLVKPRGKNPFLATGSGDTITPQYWLVPRVTHQPDPDALPDEGVIADEIEEEALNTVNRILEEA